MTSRGSLGLFAGFACAGALVFVLTAAAPSLARSASLCSPSWQVVPFVAGNLDVNGQPPNSGVVSAMAAQSPSDTWALFDYDGAGNDAPLIEHWDGVQWSVSWQARSTLLELNGLAASSPAAAWAVGGELGSSGGSHLDLSRQVIMHWDGSAWQSVPTPRVRGQTYLDDVVALADNDVWVVGQRWLVADSANRHRQSSWSGALIEHWDGNSWKVVHSPSIGPRTLIPTPRNSSAGGLKEPASASALYSVAAASPSNIWAVGEYERALKLSKKKRRADGVDYRSRLLTAHWNGTKWTLGPTFPTHGTVDPAPADLDPIIDSIAAAPSGEVLGLGDFYALFRRPVWWLHGSTWKPDRSWSQSLMYEPHAAAVISSDDTWVMGPASGKIHDYTLAAAHWDGTQWQRTKLPAQGAINAVAHTATDDIWAGGGLAPLTGDTSQQVMLHYTC